MSKLEKKFKEKSWIISVQLDPFKNPFEAAGRRISICEDPILLVQCKSEENNNQEALCIYERKVKKIRH